MKRVIWFLAFLFIISFSLALPEIKFQNEAYQPQETIIGSIAGISDYSLITREDLHIYEQRREIFFEKDIMRANDSYYFYIIPTKEGDFSIKIDDVVFSAGGGGDLQKNFSIVKQLNQNNKTQVLTVRPGLYLGSNPEINLVNSGEESLNITINGATSLVLLSGDSKKITENISDGFSFLQIVSYDSFSVPIYKDFIVEPVNNYTNETNITTNNYDSCVVINQSFSLNYLIGGNNTLNISIINSCDFPIENIDIVSDSGYVVPQDDSISMNASDIKNIIFNLDINRAGAFVANIDFYIKDNTIAQTKIIIFSFKNESSLEKFNQTYETTQTQAKPSCEELAGVLCTSTQSCSTDNYAPYYINSTVLTCCFDSCVELEPPVSWSNILIGLLGFALIAGVVYLLYKRSKKIKNVNPEDKFKEVDKKYQKNILGDKK